MHFLQGKQTILAKVNIETVSFAISGFKLKYLYHDTKSSTEYTEYYITNLLNKSCFLKYLYHLQITIFTIYIVYISYVDLENSNYDIIRN